MNTFDSTIEILEKEASTVCNCTVLHNEYIKLVFRSVFDKVVYSLAHTVQNIIFNQ
jgi:hypothetical protein